jgi:hypothetical protein
MPKRKYVEGFSSGPEEYRYPQPATKNDNVSTKELGLEAGCDVTKDSILTFRLRVGPSEFIR